MVAKVESEELAPGVEVVEYYKDYSPPFDAVKPVRRLLEHLPGKYLKGLYGVTLTNSQSTRHLRKGYTRSRKKKVRFADCLGLYGGGRITLIVDKIFRDYPDYFLRLPFVRTMLLGEVLYHEIGHHIHRTQKPDRRDLEFVADEWRDKLMRSFMWERYWYLRGMAAPCRFLSRVLWPPRERRGKGERGA
jgi:hypothetical protein